MKILLANKFFYRKGGSETYYFALGEALQKAGHEVIWFSMSHPDNLPCDQSEYFVDFVDYNAEVSALQKLKNAISSIYSTKAREKFKRLLLAERPDIVHVNNIHKQITLSVLDACEECNVPVVATSHDWIYICPNYQKLRNGAVCELCQDGNIWNCAKTGCVQGSKLRSLLATVESMFYMRTRRYNKVDLYIVPSECMASRMSAAKFTSSEIVCMRNFLADMSAAKKEVTEASYFIYLGRLVEEKGVRTLIRAYSKADVAQELYILGEGPLREELGDLAESLGCAERVHIVGAKYGDELIEFVEKSLALVLPSEIMENCPYSIMEAMTMGKPVIGSRIGGIPELIVEEITGYCYIMGDSDSLAEKLSAVSLLSTEKYMQMSVAAHAYALENFSKEKYVKELLKRYEFLIEKRGAPVWE